MIRESYPVADANLRGWNECEMQLMVGVMEFVCCSRSLVRCESLANIISGIQLLDHLKLLAVQMLTHVSNFRRYGNNRTSEIWQQLYQRLMAFTFHHVRRCGLRLMAHSGYDH